LPAALIAADLHEAREPLFLNLGRHVWRHVVRRRAFHRRILERAHAIELRFVQPG
jgi:hypothetical protein